LQIPRFVTFESDPKQPPNGRDERRIGPSKDPGGHAPTTFFQRDSGPWVIHELRPGESVLAGIAPKLDRTKMLEVLVSVVSGGHKPDRCTVSDRERISTQLVGEQHVWSEEIFEGETLLVAILRPENDQICAGLRGRLRLNDRFEEVTKPKPAPAKVTLAPRCYTVEVGYLLDAGQRREFWPDSQRGIDIAPNCDLDARSVCGEAKCKLPESKARKLFPLHLAGRQCFDV
jgi:hypothetical protein